MHFEKSLGHVVFEGGCGAAFGAGIDLGLRRRRPNRQRNSTTVRRLIDTDGMRPRKASNSSDPGSLRYRLAKALVSM